MQSQPEGMDQAITYARPNNNAHVHIRILPQALSHRSSRERKVGQIWEPSLVMQTNVALFSVFSLTRFENLLIFQTTLVEGLSHRNNAPPLDPSKENKPS